MNIYSLNILQFIDFVSKIRYGYIDTDGSTHLNTFSNPNQKYLLQYPNQLIKSKVGLCFDIVELYRDYLTKKKIECESYYLEYNDGKTLETHAFIIQKRKNNIWYECLDNSWDEDFKPHGYHDKETLIKSIYEWFQSFVGTYHHDVDKTKFFLAKYDYPAPVLKKKMSLQEFCNGRDYLDTHRLEYSGMAIVFCQHKVLVLETKHNEYVFPKGHIEEGETSKDAAIRECQEESGVDIHNSSYYGECNQYDYTFSSGHLKIPNDDFYKTFGVNSITKNIKAHVFSIDEFQPFVLEPIFIQGLWIDIDEACKIITHSNTRDIFDEALALYKKGSEN